VSPTDPKSIFFRRIIDDSPLEATAIGHNGTAATLTSQEVAALLPEAIRRWHAAGVDTAGLGSIPMQTAVLGGATLGLAAGHTIWLDSNAAGWDWFVEDAVGRLRVHHGRPTRASRTAWACSPSWITNWATFVTMSTPIMA
jgi:hypothetical protein